MYFFNKFSKIAHFLSPRKETLPQPPLIQPSKQESTDIVVDISKEQQPPCDRWSSLEPIDISQFVDEKFLEEKLSLQWEDLSLYNMNLKPEEFNEPSDPIGRIQIGRVRLNVSPMGIFSQAQQIQELETFENMYLSSGIFIGQKCNGKQLTNTEWREIIHTKSLCTQAKKNIYFSILKGIDFQVRKDVWELLADTATLKSGSAMGYSQLKNPSGISEEDRLAIDKDVPRSCSVTVYIMQLRHILIAYVKYSGQHYTQGMNFIVGSLLSLLDLKNDHMLQELEVIEDEFEERVFWVFVGIMKNKGWEKVFENNLAGVVNMLDALKTLMQKCVPRIYERITSFELDLTIFSQHYITIMLYNTPREFSKVVLDLFLLDGETVIHSLLIRMMSMQQEKILNLEDIGQFMVYMRRDFVQDCFNRLQESKQAAYRLEDIQLNYMIVDTN